MKREVVRIGWMAALLVAASACRCGPEGVVHKYRADATVEGRARYVLHPEETLPRMKAHYGNRPIPVYDSRIEPAVAMQEPGAPGDWVSVTSIAHGKNGLGQEVQESHDYFLKKTDEGYRIDWEASAGVGDMTPAAFQAQRPLTPTRMRLLAKLSDYYNFEFARAQASHYSVELDPPDDVAVLYGYVARSHPRAESLFNLLKDGRAHPVTVKVRYLPYSQSATTALITDIESLTWVVEP